MCGEFASCYRSRATRRHEVRFDKPGFSESSLTDRLWRVDLRAIYGFGLAFLILMGGEASAGAARIECTPSAGDARFRLFSTENIWTLLKLDTRTERLWQVQASIDGDQIKSVINAETIADGGRNGRFTSCPTGNMWTFILLDQETGRTWQVQFRMSPSEHGIVDEITIPIDLPPLGQ
jgi:hypothetical protein